MTTLCYILVYFFESVICYMYFENKFKPKISSKLLGLLPYLMSFAIQYAINFAGISYLNLISFLICAFLLAYLFYKVTLVQAMFNSILLTAMILISELCIFYLSTFIFGNDFVSLPSAEYILLLQKACIELLYFSIALLILKISSKKEKQAFIITKATFLFLLPTASVLLLFGIVRITELYSTDSYIYAIFIASAILLLFSNIVVFGVYESIIKTHNENTELKLQKQKSEIDTTYYTILQNQYENSNILIHDIKRHLLSIKELCNEKDCDGIVKYIDNLYGEYQIKHIKKYSNNRLVNAIINRYAISFKEKNIDFYCDIRDIDFSFISDNDLTSILDNLLENSMDASELSKDKTIELSIMPTNLNFITINIWNTCSKAPKLKNGSLVSTKKNDYIHGFGIKSIERITREYDGNIDYSFDKDKMVFTTKIVLKNSK